MFQAYDMKRKFQDLSPLLKSDVGEGDDSGVYHEIYLEWNPSRRKTEGD